MSKRALDVTFAVCLLEKAREIYTYLSLEQTSDYDNVKELILKAYESWSKRLTCRNLEIVEKNMTRLMWNLLEQKNNYLVVSALQKVGYDHAKNKRQLMIDD